MARKSRNRGFGYKLAQIENNTKHFDSGVACNVDIKEEIEDREKKYVLVFTYYNNDACGIARIKSKREKIIIDLLQEINGKKMREKFRNIIRENGATKDYKKLFAKLPNGIDYIVEVGKSRTEERVFGFIINNYFCVVSIDGQHLKSKTNKW